MVVVSGKEVVIVVGSEKILKFVRESIPSSFSLFHSFSLVLVKEVGFGNSSKIKSEVKLHCRELGWDRDICF